MKKHLFFLLLALPFFSNAQFSENFDASTAIPSGWTVINGGDANGFVVGPSSTGSAFSAPNSVYIVYSASAHDDYLVTPKITVTAGVSDRLTYYVKNQDPAYVENYDVKLSTTTADVAGLTTTITASAPAPNTWTQFTINLSAYVGQSIYIGFHASSTDMFRLHLDNIVNDAIPTTIPDCPTLTSPANGATDVTSVAPLTLTWSAPTTGSAPASYDLYLDTNPDPTTLKGNYLTTTATIPALLGSTVYYWKVIPKNSVGAPSTCSVSSFTTGVNPYAPYCGPVVFSTSVEPITLVNFAGINNATSQVLTGANTHELFTSIVGNVQTGNTYPIILKGNTDGDFTNRFIVFIDWNQNGVLNDAGEVYFSGTADMNIYSSSGIDGIQAYGNIAVPSTALAGNTRMRVKKIFGTTSFVDPCIGTLYGQAEDYTINVTVILATDDVSKQKTLIYPNPVKDILRVSDPSSRIKTAEIYNLEGKLVKKFILNSNSGEFNLSSFKPGNYLLKLIFNDKEKSFKIIKE